MNKQDALIVLNQSYMPEETFITIWKNHKILVYCNTIGEALEELNKLTNKNKYIALEIDDHFMSELKDWYVEID